MKTRHITLITAASTVALLAACDSGPPPALQVSSIAAPRNIATGGDALIKVVLPEGASADRVTLNVNGAPAQATLKAGAGGLIAKVSGLKDGANTITALYRDKEAGSVTVANYSAAGPIFSGPHQTPFFWPVGKTDSPGVKLRTIAPVGNGIARIWMTVLVI